MSSWKTKGIAAGAVASLLLIAPLAPAQAYDPEGGIVYEVGDQDCLKGLGNCAVYPKSAQLPSGRLVAAFERSTVVEYEDDTTGAIGQTMPIYASDDLGSSWQPLSEVQAPAFLSDDPEFDPYTSNWTNPYLYVLPEDVGDLEAGTLLLATVVSGEDEFYREQKAADPEWVPTNDGDRRDMAIALFASTDQAESWDVVDIIATGGWQGGSAGNIGSAIAEANEHAQIDPLWEPHLHVHDGLLVTYYSDENDYVGYDPVTGVPELTPDNETGPDSGRQILVHRTWDGEGEWSEPVVDVAGETVDFNGSPQIGHGRPGMTNIVPTTDGLYMLTYEYFGSETWGWPAEANVRFELSADPLDFFSDGDDTGEQISRWNEDMAEGLPFYPGAQGLSWGGSPVVIALPDGRLVYNAAGNGDVWVNESGASDGLWQQYNTTMGSGYSRNLQYVEGTGRIVILQGTWGGPFTGAVIRYGEVDLGHSQDDYYQVVNRATGKVLGTGGNISDAEFDFPKWVPDIQLEDQCSEREDTQNWHVIDEGDGTVELLNRSGGRSVAMWGGGAYDGQDIAQWVDENDGGRWTIQDADDGHVRFLATGSDDLYLTGTADGDVALRLGADDGTQEWMIVPVAPTITVKDEAKWTVGEDGVYRKASYVIETPACELTSILLNGVEQGPATGTSFDLDQLTPDYPGVVRGVNVIEATNSLGDTTVLEFSIGKKEK
ncbi:RICIN domain-containing protein [Agromyces sp. SYSU T00266]|uniref:RICIN domain-containing protein n=1 Tax=Agromyces zhanjiangensis TaxID=3158562 RepID=UPI003395C2C7